MGIAVFIDFKKAFDTVNHNILLKKLMRYGIKDNELKWFQSYLSNRTQYFFVNGVLSSSQIISCGVPQGSILRPLLFFIYVNDLPGCLSESIPNMYPDDTNITAYHTNINKVEHVLNKDLDILYRWLQANRLSLNVLKSEYMLISDPKIFIRGHSLKRVVVTKSLGLMIDENISWEEHVNYISRKVAKDLGMLRRIRDLVQISTLVDIYSSIILPHFEYCSSVWDNCRKGLRDKLQKLQNRAARIITRSTYEIRSSQILNNLN